jgi:ribosomal protein S27AE
MTTAKMQCPKCGTLMNHHADKPDRSATLAKSQSHPNTEMDIELANIMEVHFCPGCGNTEVRQA